MDTSKSKHVSESVNSPTMPHAKSDKMDKMMDRKKGIKEGSAKDQAIDSGIY